MLREWLRVWAMLVAVLGAPKQAAAQKLRRVHSVRRLGCRLRRRKVDVGGQLAEMVVTMLQAAVPYDDHAQAGLVPAQRLAHRAGRHRFQIAIASHGVAVIM